MTARIGLFGGSFDPVHRAHVALARVALEQLGLDEVRWIPVGIPWQKSRQLADAADREAMVRIAIEGEPRFVLDRIELRRKGPSFTLDTVREKVAHEPDTHFHLILGHDQYATLHTWRDWRELVSLVTLAIADRAGMDGTRAEPDPQVASLAREIVRLPEIDVSSTDVRERIAKGRPIDDLVPEGVARYIADHGLYRTEHRS